MAALVLIFIESLGPYFIKQCLCWAADNYEVVVINIENTFKPSCGKIINKKALMIIYNYQTKSLIVSFYHKKNYYFKKVRL